jgi:hypothetical protein
LRAAGLRQSRVSDHQKEEKQNAMKLASRVAGLARSLIEKRPRVGVAAAMVVAPFRLWGQTPAWVLSGSNLYVRAGTNVGIGTMSPDSNGWRRLHYAAGVQLGGGIGA